MSNQQRAARSDVDPAISPGGYTHESDFGSFPPPDELREHMLSWYIDSGTRGCLFNKFAARQAQTGELTWLTPVEYADIDAIVSGDAGQRVVKTFESLVGDGSEAGLVSYIFPGLTQPSDYARLLKFLTAANPERFAIFPEVDQAELGPVGSEEEYVGVQWRIALGKTPEGETVYSYPMIYTPDWFTTFARRYDYFKITFNRHISKNNPETPDTFIGVDDIQLGLSDQAFAKLFARSVSVNLDAHSVTGKAEPDEQFSRKLFRAHNAIVLPLSAWSEADNCQTHQQSPAVTASGSLAVKQSAADVPSNQVDQPDIKRTKAGKKSKPGYKPPLTDEEKKSLNRRRGHPMKGVKEHLAQTGKLNAKKPMPTEQRRKRRRKK